MCQMTHGAVTKHTRYCSGVPRIRQFPASSAPERLTGGGRSFVSSKDLSGFWIDQVHAGAGQALQRFVSFDVALGQVIGCIALDLQPGVWAPIKKSCH